MISLYFGSPGCGKTTLAARFVHFKKQKGSFSTKYVNVYTNFECKGALKLNCSDLETFVPEPNSLLIIDESGIEYNNRNYKKMPQSVIEFFKLHRHYKVDIVFLSQSWEDTDITIRRLANRLFYIRKIGPFTMVRKVRKFITVDKDTHQIIDGYEFISFLSALIPLSDKPFYVFLRNPYYQFFDSYSAPVRPYLSSDLWYPYFVPQKHLFSYFLKLENHKNR